MTCVQRLQCYSPDSNVEAKAICTASTYFIRCVQVDDTSPRCPPSPPAASKLRRWSRWPDGGRQMAKRNGRAHFETITRNPKRRHSKLRRRMMGNGTSGTDQGDTDDPSTRNGTRRTYRHYGHLRPEGG